MYALPCACVSWVLEAGVFVWGNGRAFIKQEDGPWTQRTVEGDGSFIVLDIIYHSKKSFHGTGSLVLSQFQHSMMKLLYVYADSYIILFHKHGSLRNQEL